MNGAQKIINAMKQINKSGQSPTSQIVSATCVSLNPLKFQLENRLTIDSSFYELNSMIDWSTIAVGDKVKCFSFNNSQKYYINEIMVDKNSLEKQVSDLTIRVENLEQIINNLGG